MTERWWKSWQRWWPFALLCLAAWVQWNLADSLFEAASTPLSEGYACLLAGVVCAGVALVKRRPRSELSGIAKAAVGGALLLCGPEAAMFLHPHALTAAGMTIALALVPVVVVVGSGAGDDAGGVSVAALWPGIAAASALLLLLPQPGLGDARTDTALLLAPVATGCGGVLLFRARQTAAGKLWQAAGAFAGAALIFAAGAAWDLPAARRWSAPGLPAISIDLALAGLAVLAVLRLNPRQYAARYVLVPLLVLLEGWTLLRPSLTVRAVGGIALLAAGGVALLMDREKAGEDAGIDTPPTLL